MGKKSGFGVNIPDNFSDSLESVFLGFKILQFFDADPGSGIFLTHVYPGSATLDYQQFDLLHFSTG
jgi:hypothetical protein